MQGESGEDRKNIGLTIKSFYELFKNRANPPALILKCCIVNGSILDKSEILRMIIKEFKLDRNINSRSWPKWLTEIE